MVQSSNTQWARVPRALTNGAMASKVLLAGLSLYVVGLCVVPLLLLFAEIGTTELPTVAEVMAAPSTRLAAYRTVEASLGATAVSLVLGGYLALVLGAARPVGRAFLTFLVLVPMLVPAQIAALAWLELTGPSSVILGAIGLAPEPGTRNPLYSREGIILLMGIEHMPIVFLAVRAGLRSIPNDLLEAGNLAGAGSMRSLWRIVFPLLRPSFLAGGALAFAAAVGNFGIPALLGIPGRYTMLTALIYQRLSGFGPSVLGEVAVLSLLLALIAVIALTAQGFAQARARVVLSGQGMPVQFKVSQRTRIALTVSVLLLLIPASVLPVFALVGTSVVKALGLPLTSETMTISHYADVLSNSTARRAFVNSAWLSAASAVLSMLIAVPLAWMMLNRRNRLARVLNRCADLPYALPGVVISIAFILAFLRPIPVLGIGLYGTGWLILLAYLARFLALSLRPVTAAFEAMDPALDEAARIAGAGPVLRMRRILLPSVAPAAGAGVLLVVLSAYNELTVSALLWSRGNETVGVLVFNLYDEGNATGAAAASVLAVAVTFAAAALATAIARWLPKGVLPWQA
ncbi:iron ABC transporter permease [Pseudovibrio sp. SPO723]|uniref:ABC transporter permease n=1 Tax=Nesiotobacter zosterae TaxID=392721 RepID=UPI0029C5DB36|nr:iron ABC transporter permease [Pseudovibrio sp. SPO723]MDX5594568.1 iron ABC transporter permease [Pseudovibrio sp. SPO723]